MPNPDRSFSARTPPAIYSDSVGSWTPWDRAIHMDTPDFCHTHQRRRKGQNRGCKAKIYLSFFAEYLVRRKNRSSSRSGKHRQNTGKRMATVWSMFERVRSKISTKIFYQTLRFHENYIPTQPTVYYTCHKTRFCIWPHRKWHDSSWQIPPKPPSRRKEP